MAIRTEEAGAPQQHLSSSLRASRRNVSLEMPRRRGGAKKELPELWLEGRIWA